MLWGTLDTKKLVKSLSNNYILIPHINRYLSNGIFPDFWDIRLYNNREDDGFFHPSSDCLTHPKDLFLQKTGKVKRE